MASYDFEELCKGDYAAVNAGDVLVQKDNVYIILNDVDKLLNPANIANIKTEHIMPVDVYDSLRIHLVDMRTTIIKYIEDQKSQNKLSNIGELSVQATRPYEAWAVRVIIKD